MSKIGLMFGIGILIGVSYLSSLVGKDIIKDKKELSSLVKQAISISAGQDKIWSQNEKKKFLEKNELDYFFLQKENNIFCQPDAYENGVKLYSGKTYLGLITKKNLQNYIREDR